MIGYLCGTALTEDIVLVAPSPDAAAAGHGVGYHVKTLAPLPVGETVALHIHPVIAENTFDLYGFTDPIEARVFALLLKASGVGARTARNILATHGAAGTLTALLAEDAKTLAKAPGLGPKTAARVCQDITVPEDLRAHATPAANTAEQNTDADDVHLALVRLGYPEDRVHGVLTELRTAEDGPRDEATLLRAAISAMAS